MYPDRGAAIRARLTPVPDRHDPNGIEPGTEPELILTRASDVEAEPVDYLWPPYLPIGKLTLLQGDPGLGKTWIAVMVAAAVTRGEALLPRYDGVTPVLRDPGTVLYLSAEDGIADTLRPRLEAANADLTKVVFLEGLWRPARSGGRRIRAGITLRDAENLRRAIEMTHPSLLVIDPLLAYLGGADSNKAHEVREVLMPLTDLAQEHHIAVLALRHLSKGQTARAHQRGQGSGDFMASARSVLLAGENPDGERAVIQIKNNVGALGPAIAYEISRDGRLYWRGRSNLTAGDLLAPDGKPGARTVANREDAREFILDILKDGPKGATSVYQEAGRRGISGDVLRGAKEKLKQDGVVMHRRISDNNQGSGNWEWYLVSQEGSSASQDETLLSPSSHVADSAAQNTATTGSQQDGQVLPAPILQMTLSQDGNLPSSHVATIQLDQPSWQEGSAGSVPRACASGEYLEDPEEEADASSPAEGDPW